MAQDNRLNDEFKARSLELLGPNGILSPPDNLSAYTDDWRGRMKGETPFVARPKDTQGCAKFVSLCAEHGVRITPLGGNTGLVLGGVPQNGEIVLSTQRMNAIRNIDPVNDSITVEAGVTLAEVQEAARSVGRLFPLSLAAEGEARIGGVISTNAGGVAVLRYGMMRDLVMGVEAVLPDGRIWDGLTALRKNNTGYDLKQLFIGGEGTLGVVTAAVLKLFPQPAEQKIAWLAVDDPQSAVDMLAMARAETGGAVSSFELMPRWGVDTVLKQFESMRDPLPDATADWFVLMEVSFARKEGASDAMDALLEQAFEKGYVTDGVLAQNETQAKAIWHIRESLPLAEKAMGKAVKHDIAVPVSRIPDFLQVAGPALRQEWSDIRIMSFGHVGDGNLHYNIVPPEGVDDDVFCAEHGASITQIVHDIVCDMNGSISAEHGIGRLKRDELAARSSDVELDMMRAVKRALDPENRFNPGRIVDNG